MKTILSIIVISISINAMAQKQNILELNEVFEGKYEFSSAKNGIKIDLLKDGKIIRQEFFRMAEIDWEKLDFNESDNSIIITCLDYYSSRIDRKIIQTKSRRAYSKTSLKIESAEKADSAMEILKRFSSE